MDRTIKGATVKRYYYLQLAEQIDWSVFETRWAEFFGSV